MIWFALFIVPFFQSMMIGLCHSFATAKEKAWAGRLIGPAETANAGAIQEM